MARRWDGKESRWGERFLVDIPVEVSVTDLTGAAGRMKNLSLSGALVKADASLGLHSIIHVFISVPSVSSGVSTVRMSSSTCFEHRRFRYPEVRSAGRDAARIT